MVSREQPSFKQMPCNTGSSCAMIPGLFPDFAFCRFKECFSPLDPAAWQEPARPVGVPHQKDPVFIIKYRGSRAQSKASRLPV